MGFKSKGNLPADCPIRVSFALFSVIRRFCPPIALSFLGPSRVKGLDGGVKNAPSRASPWFDTFWPFLGVPGGAFFTAFPPYFELVMLKNTRFLGVREAIWPKISREIG